MTRNISNRGNDNSNYRSETIVVSLLRKQIEKTVSLTLLLAFVGGIYSLGLILHIFIALKINIGILVAIVMIIIALLLRLKLLRYRIFKGYYGNNCYEAKEIIKFINEEDDDKDSSGGGSSNKNVFPRALESSEQISEDWEEGLEGQRA